MEKKKKVNKELHVKSTTTAEVHNAVTFFCVPVRFQHLCGHAADKKHKMRQKKIYIVCVIKCGTGKLKKRLTFS